MSDNHSSDTTAETKKIAPQGDLDTANAENTPENNTVVEDVWETVPLPGSLSSNAFSSDPLSEEETAPENGQTSQTADVPQPAHTVTTERETELLSLIHDLNECNDVLLSKISQLESDVDTARRQLKTEVEKASLTQERMAKQMSAEQVSIQQVSQNAQQQVGKLVSQLETAERGLRNQQLVSENLQTELDNAQERITQLERDCAMASQQHAEEAKERVKAEATSRDLRSRLQRQQRYTLQFKVALEKSLSVSTRAASGSVNNVSAQPVPFNAPAAATNGLGVSMPKAQKIMPWAAAATPFQGIDPHLETLIRNAGKPQFVEESPSVSSVAASIATDAANVNASETTSATEDLTSSKTTSDVSSQTASASSVVDPEAEENLWQNLERVINTTVQEPLTPPTPLESQDADETTSDKTVADNEVVVSDKVAVAPKFNWQAPVKANTSKTEKAKAEREIHQLTTVEGIPADESVDTTEKKKVGAATPSPILKKQVAKPIPPATSKSALSQSTQQTQFTEPSPWGKPLSNAVPAANTSAAIASSTQQGSTADYIPAIENAVGSTISPVVKPLNPQKKKVGSLAAVELPTFQTAKAGSFKR